MIFFLTAIEDGRSYLGGEVDRAGRLTALAHGGQILASDATAALLRDRVTLRGLGERR